MTSAPTRIATATGTSASARPPFREPDISVLFRFDVGSSGTRRWYHHHVELRRFTRAPLDQPAEFKLKSADHRFGGRAKDISVGGMFIETDVTPAFGAEVVVFVTLPSDPKELRLPGVVRWTRPTGMGVQFGLLGARETYAITEIVKKAELP